MGNVVLYIVLKYHNHQLIGSALFRVRTFWNKSRLPGDKGREDWNCVGEHRIVWLCRFRTAGSECKLVRTCPFVSSSSTRLMWSPVLHRGAQAPTWQKLSTWLPAELSSVSIWINIQPTPKPPATSCRVLTVTHTSASRWWWCEQWCTESNVVVVAILIKSISNQ